MTKKYHTTARRVDDENKTRILLFSISCGRGHNSVAEAIENILSEAGFEVTISDMFVDICNKLDAIKYLTGNSTDYTKSYNRFAQNQRWLRTYVCSLVFYGFINLRRSAVKQSFRNFLVTQEPHIVITTMGAFNSILADLSEELGFALLAISTDLNSFDTLNSMRRSLFGISIGRLPKEFRNVKVVTAFEDLSSYPQLRDVFQPTQIVRCGFPVRAAFRSAVANNQEYLIGNISENERRHILITGGSLGIGVYDLVGEILEVFQEIRFPEKIRIVVLCGSNRVVQAQLLALVRFAKAYPQGENRSNSKGETNSVKNRATSFNVNYGKIGPSECGTVIVEAIRSGVADIDVRGDITDPFELRDLYRGARLLMARGCGGVTSAEALTCGVPLLVRQPILPWERRNATILRKKQWGDFYDSKEELRVKFVDIIRRDIRVNADSIDSDLFLAVLEEILFRVKH